ncbi:hypothetical protein [Palleronia caenipelagi]|uniref:Uncharacterized protein n=1 Tax=Palleronia caenipelagi TaxID=2489174 RepID=A0A547PS70_9RHOB|nr:hypothetical protein [Palleronia caenipelagi]TRD16983.1 hypothetical protein FEV53_13685 [Palleronia caenipelagi]
MITLAFYKGRTDDQKDRIVDALIRFATRSAYSHVELIGGVAQLGEEAVCFSSSSRDGGVREKRILLRPDHWDLVFAPIDPEPPVAVLTSHLGARYDMVGILLSQTLALGRHDPDKWFCSEIIAAALGLSSPQRYSPQLLCEVVQWAWPRPLGDGDAGAGDPSAADADDLTS